MQWGYRKLGFFVPSPPPLHDLGPSSRSRLHHHLPLIVVCAGCRPATPRFKTTSCRIRPRSTAVQMRAPILLPRQNLSQVCGSRSPDARPHSSRRGWVSVEGCRPSRACRTWYYSSRKFFFCCFGSGTFRIYAFEAACHQSKLLGWNPTCSRNAHPE